VTGAHETDIAGIGPFRRTEFLAPQTCVRVFVDTARSYFRPRPAVSFPKSRVEVVAYREGNGQRTRYLPGRLVHDRLVLQRAAVTNSGLHAWWRTVSGAVQRRSMSVIPLDATAQEAQRWNVFETRPVSYDVTDLSALGNDVVLETIEIVHEGLELAQS